MTRLLIAAFSAPLLLATAVPAQTSPGEGGAGIGSPAGSTQVCGNRILENGEDCDDGNAQDGDGCSSSCSAEIFCSPAAYDSGDLCLDAGYDPVTRHSDHVFRVTGLTNHESAGGKCGAPGFYYVVRKSVIELHTPLLPAAGEYVFSFEYSTGTSGQLREDYSVACGDTIYDFPDTGLAPEQFRSKAILCSFDAGVNAVVFASTGLDSVHFEDFRMYHCKE